MTVERRAATELRAAGGRKLAGYAAVFNTPAQIGSFREIVRPGAFTATLASRQDVRALVDHDPTKLLGRVSAGTLKLDQDSRGLAFEIEMPDTQLGNDVLTLAKRGDVNSMSFGFMTPAGGDAWPAPDRRELMRVDLHEISVLHVLPAYSATSVQARARELHAEAQCRRLYVLGLI
jgi:HK97 family phage prohead protease